MSDYSDPSDRATLAEMAEREKALERLREHRRRNTLKPRGRCWNCEETVPRESLFCDTDCAEDYEWRKQRQEVNRGG